MKKTIAVIILSAVVATMIVFGATIRPTYMKGLKAIEDAENKRRNDSYTENALSNAKSRIATLEKTLNTDPDVLRKVFHLKGFDSVNIKGTRYAYSGDREFTCTIFFNEPATGAKMNVDSSGYSPELAMQGALRRITILRKDLCELLEE